MKNIRILFHTALLVATAVFTACLDATDDSGFIPETPRIAFEEPTLTIEKTGAIKQ